MRKSCFECVLKHLGSAGVFVKETKMGYPKYAIWVVGELEHAADECLEVHRELAMVIREHRIAWYEKRHAIPFEAIGEYVEVCMSAEYQGIPFPEIPQEMYEGLEMEDGKPVFHGDTRP